MHELLAGPGVHVLAPDTVPPLGRPGPLLHVHRLDGVPGGGLIAVRPDGHVGFSGAAGDEAGLIGWLERAGAGRLTA